MADYVHGYSERERQRLHDQANTLADLLHHDTVFPPGALVLEAGTGVGATTALVAARNPDARIVSVDFSAQSLAEARNNLHAAGVSHVRLSQSDAYRLPFPDGCFDVVFCCFLLEHLEEPTSAAREWLRVLKPGGRVISVEGDHGSCHFHPETDAARRVWQCLIDVQAVLGGDANIGRRLGSVLTGGGLGQVAVSPRTVWCDATRPEWVEGFVRNTIIPMVAGVREAAIAQGMATPAQWAQGMADLQQCADDPMGSFTYLFYKGTAVKGA